MIATPSFAGAHALDGEGVRAAYAYVYGPGTPFPVREPDDAGDYLLNVIST
jgi:hypothetical protein